MVLATNAYLVRQRNCPSVISSNCLGLEAWNGHLRVAYGTLKLRAQTTEVSWKATWDAVNLFGQPNLTLKPNGISPNDAKHRFAK